MDETKAAMGAMTMVGGDHFFLKRWVDYYSKQLGREHLYILSHGGDPEHRKIAEGCNIIYLPFDPSRHLFNKRRWEMMSMFASGFLRYYNWFLTGDVDEIVAVDPDVSTSLPDYLNRFDPKERPPVISPMAIEMVHNPTLEKEPITDEDNILKVRKIFRLNANYNKPCISRNTVKYAPGGHFSTEDRKFLDPDLYLFHLRFIDYDICKQRSELRRAHREAHAGSMQETGRKSTGWDQTWETYMGLSKLEPVAQTVDFPDVRRALNDGWRRFDDSPYYTFGGGRSKEVYQLPDRFADVF